MTQEMIILVDEQDNILGHEEKMKTHELGLLHRAFSIFIYSKEDKTVEILLQQRADDKYHCPGLWTNTCCSHPRMGEETKAAAKRRLKEEMFLDVPLKEIGSFSYKAVFNNGLTENEFDHVFVGEYDTNQPIILNENEAQAYRWVEINTLLQELEDFPERFTPWFKPALQLVTPYFSMI